MCSADDFITRMEWSLEEREDTLFCFAVQMPGEMLYVSHLTMHCDSMPDLETILAGCDCYTGDDTEPILPLFDSLCIGCIVILMEEIIHK